MRGLYNIALKSLGAAKKKPAEVRKCDALFSGASGAPPIPHVLGRFALTGYCATQNAAALVAAAIS